MATNLSENLHELNRRSAWHQRLGKALPNECWIGVGLINLLPVKLIMEAFGRFFRLGRSLALPSFFCCGSFRGLRCIISTAILLALLPFNGVDAKETSADSLQTQPKKPLRIRELYVPYKEFMKLTKKTPDAAMMSLKEYRALVEKAVGNVLVRKRKKAQLPPLEYSITHFEYKGQAQEFAVRFEATFEIFVSKEEWVRCDLGILPTGLGQVLLDGKPGWVIVPKARRGHLLIKGKGLHKGSISFTVPLKREDDVFKLATALPRSGSGLLTLDVPGRARSGNDAKTLLIETKYDSNKDRTNFTIPLGRRAAFSFSWKGTYSAQQNHPLLLAHHSIRYLLRESNPRFSWVSRIRIDRQRSGELFVRPPPGGKVTKLAGPNIHSWKLINNELRILLNKRIRGDVKFEAEGIIPVTGNSYELGGPKLKGASRDACVLTLFETRGNQFSITGHTGYSQISLSEGSQKSMANGTLFRALRRETTDATSDATVKVALRATPQIFDAQATCRMQVNERRVEMNALLTAHPEHGRMYKFNLRLPPIWTLEKLTERGSNRGLTFEQEGGPTSDRWTLTLERAAQPNSPLAIALKLALRDPSWEKQAWRTKNLNILIPYIEGGRRSTSYLGIGVHPELNAVFEGANAWQTEGRSKLEKLNLVEKDFFRAGLRSSDPTKPVSAKFHKKVSRGEFDLVTHVLTLEREVWVRADIRLTVGGHALNELTIHLPAEAKDPLYVNAEGLIEVAKGKSTRQRILRFSQAWQGVRLLRVAYRIPLKPDSERPVPIINLDDRFDGRQRIVFQSGGAVKLTVKPGSALALASIEETPAFSKPFKNGRAIAAYTIHGLASAQTPPSFGSYGVEVFQRSEVLRGVVRKMELTTQLDPVGVARTYASFLLSYSRDQYISLYLPDADLLAASVDGQRVKPVTNASNGAINIPLPPRSFAQVELVYEHSRESVGLWGSWKEQGPDLTPQGIPTGMTDWTVYYPAAYKMQVIDGNMKQKQAAPPSFFAISFWKRIVSGRLPAWTAWSTPASQTPVAYHSKSKKAGTDQTPQQQGELQALQSKEIAKANARKHADAYEPLSGMVIPEGHRLSAHKLGGGPVQSFSIIHGVWDKTAKRTMFIVALLIGLFLARRKSKRALFQYIGWGLVLGTLIPPALNWNSPLLCVPFCEGLSLVAMITLIVAGFRALQRFATRLNEPTTPIATQVLLVLMLTGGAFCSSASASETPTKHPLPSIRNGEIIWLQGTNGQVLIPYNLKKNELPWSTKSSNNAKAYVPKALFSELIKHAYPEKIDATDDALIRRLFPASHKSKPVRPNIPLPVVFGNAVYELSISAEAKAYEIKGKLEVRSFGKKGWSRMYLATGPSQLASISVNGKTAQISMDRRKNPFVLIPGAGSHAIELVLRGPIQSQPGQAELVAGLIGGAATRMSVSLPEGMELQKKSSAGLWLHSKTSKSGNQYELQLGETFLLKLRWHSAKIKGQIASQINTQSYTNLHLADEGYLVHRVEKVEIDGTPVERLSYQIIGDWEIGNIAARDLAEWHVNGEGSARRLVMIFSKPSNAIYAEIVGWASLGAKEKGTLAGLSLEHALRQEGFVGLKHGQNRRFASESLKGLKRSTAQKLSSVMGLSKHRPADRTYRFLKPSNSVNVVAEYNEGRITLETAAVGLIKERRLLVSVRSRYRVHGFGPIRHEVPLPKGWKVIRVSSPLMRSWRIESNNGQRILSIAFKIRAYTGSEVIWSAELPLQADPKAPWKLDLPLPRVQAVSDPVGGRIHQENVSWVLAADPALSLTQKKSTTMRSVPLTRAPKWVDLAEGGDYRFALQSTKPDAKLSVTVSRRTSVGSAMVVTFLRPAENFVMINARLRFDIHQRGMDQFSIKLPGNANVLSLAADNLRSWTATAKAGAVELIVRLQTPVRGQQVVDLSYRYNRKAGTDVRVGGLEIQNTQIQKVDHYAGLVRINQGLVHVSKQTGLTPLAHAEQLPFIPAGLSTQALTKTYRGTKRWTLTLRQPEVQVDTGADAEIERATIRTVIARDGRMRSVAEYTVRNRSRQFLQVVLPDEATLWGVLVDGQPGAVSTNTSSGRNALIIPIQRMGLTGLPAEVKIIYEHQRLSLPAGLLSIKPQAPEVIGTPVIETFWQLYVPEEYGVIKTDGNVKDVVDSVLLGSKMKSSISNIERLLKTADKHESKRMKYRALQNVSRLQQALSDQMAEMDRSGQNAADYTDNRVNADELKSQLSFNRSIQGQGKKTSLELRRRGKEIEEAVTGAPEAGEEQAYRDAHQFMGNRWRAGKSYKTKRIRKHKNTGKVALENLQSTWAINGFKRNELRPSLQPKVDHKPKPIPDEDGMREEADWLAFEGMPVAELRVPLEGVAYTYRRLEGHPEITVNLRSRESTWLTAARIALGLLAVGTWLVWRRKQKLLLRLD